MVYIVLTDKEIVECFSNVEWSPGELSVVYDYCMLNKVTSLIELAYIVLYIIYTGYQGVEFRSTNNTVPIKFSDVRLKYVSEYFMDEVCILTESCQEPNFEYIDIESLYNRFEEFAKNLTSYFIVDKPGITSYEISVNKGGLICKEK